MCIGNFSGSGSDFLLPTDEPSIERQRIGCGNITCREGFYCLDGANDAVCNPSCATWKQYPAAMNTAFDFLILLSVCIEVICGVGVLVVAGIRRKKV